MKPLEPVLSHFVGKNDEAPHRIVMRDGKSWWRMLDLQVVGRSATDLSAYMKPPVDAIFVTSPPDRKFHAPPGVGSIQLQLRNDVTKGVTYFNPYLSWHGSGRLHANAFTTRELARTRLLRDSKTTSLSDAASEFHILLTAILPIHSGTYPETSPPPLDFTGNYFEVSNDPFLPNDWSKPNVPLSLVLDRRALRPGSVVLDVIAHPANKDINPNGKDHPYPKDAEMYAVAPPLKLNFPFPELPAVSFFFYQPAADGLPSIEAGPMTLWGRTPHAKDDIIFQASLLGR